MIVADTSRVTPSAGVVTVVVYSPARIIAAVIVTSEVIPSIVTFKVSFSRASAGKVIVISVSPEISEFVREASLFVSSVITTVGAPGAVSSISVSLRLTLTSVVLPTSSVAVTTISCTFANAS